jgi:hypothetical protein
MPFESDCSTAPFALRTISTSLDSRSDTAVYNTPEEETNDKKTPDFASGMQWLGAHAMCLPAFINSNSIVLGRTVAYQSCQGHSDGGVGGE